MPVLIAQDPLSCVAIGTGMVVESLHTRPMIRKMLERASRA